MRIQEITFIHRNDFKAILVCEHCQSTQRLGSGYQDDFYHRHVLPSIRCVKCGKNRAGEVAQEQVSA